MVVKQGAPSFETMTVGCPRNEVFDHALAFAQARNLEVKVLEKSSGLIRFERSSLGANDLDEYCIFPIVDARTGQPVSTFQDWDREYEGIAVGAVNLNFLLSEEGPARTLVNVRGNWSVVMRDGEIGYSGPISSNGTLEDQIREYFDGQQRCAAPTKTTTQDKIEQLRRLRDRGLITAEEFQRKQKALASD
jgi:hypothetical protein